MGHARLLQCRMWGACPSLLANAAPCMLAARGQRCSVSSPSGLALAARTTVALLNLKVQSFEEPPQAKFVSLRTIMAGAMLLVGHGHVVQRASRISQRGSGRLPQQTHRTVEWRKWPVSTTVSQLRLEVPSASYLLFSAASRAHHDPNKGGDGGQLVGPSLPCNTD